MVQCGHGGAELMFVLNSLRGLFQPKQLYGSIHKIPDQEGKIKEFCKGGSETVEFGYNSSGKPEMFR